MGQEKMAGYLVREVARLMRPGEFVPHNLLIFYRSRRLRNAGGARFGAILRGTTDDYLPPAGPVRGRSHDMNEETCVTPALLGEVARQW